MTPTGREGAIVITTPPCLLCHRTSQVELDKAAYDAWQAGATVQIAFPFLEPWMREMLLTGTHKQCWDLMFMFGDEED